VDKGKVDQRMTNKEAMHILDRLKDFAMATSEVVNSNLVEAIDIGIKAIGYRAPKEVHEDYDLDGILAYYCSSCGEFYGYCMPDGDEDEFCDGCGQALR